MATPRKIDLQETGKTVAANLARLRKARGLSIRALAAHLAELGRPINADAINNVEHHKRRVDADDLVALARALRVNPSALLLPADARGEIEVTGSESLSESLPARDVWDWADGKRPLDLPDDPAEQERAVMDFRLHARPAGLLTPSEQMDQDIRDQYARLKAEREWKDPDT